MRIRISGNANDAYSELSSALREATDKQFVFLLRDIRHPSLRAKKYDEASGLWQARVNKSWRFYFVIQGDKYLVLSITKHPK